MERKSGVRVPYNLILICMRKYFTNLNLSSALFGQCEFTLNKVKGTVETLRSSVNSLSIEDEAATKDNLNTVKGTVETLTNSINSLSIEGKAAAKDNINT
jgi:hypothetical protein